MNHPRSRGAFLSAVFAAAVAGFAAVGNIPKNIMQAARAQAKKPDRDAYEIHHRSRGAWGQGKKRYHAIINGKRIALPAGSRRPAVRWMPNVKGKRWEHGHLIPRFMLRRRRA